MYQHRSKEGDQQLSATYVVSQKRFRLHYAWPWKLGQVVVLTTCQSGSVGAVNPVTRGSSRSKLTLGSPLTLL